MKYIIVDTKENMDSACDFFMKQPVTGFDTETTSKDPRDGKLRLAQISDGVKTVIIDFFHLLRNEKREGYSIEDNFFLFEKLKQYLESRDTRKVIHYAQFESKWVKTFLNSDMNAVFDTFIASKLVNYDLMRHSLASVSKEYLNLDLDKTEQKSDWSRWELEKNQYDYAALDVFYSPSLREVLYKKLENDGLLKAAKLDFESIAPISQAEQTGLCTNRDLYKKEIIKLVELRKIASVSLQDILRVTKPNLGIQQSMFDIQEKNYSDVMLTSHDQMLQALVALGLPCFKASEVDKIAEYEKKGKPYSIGTGKKALGALAGTHPVLTLLSDFRGVEKMVTSFGDNFLEHLIEYPDGTERVHTSYSIIGAPTGRMSSKDPNTQQIPDKKVRVGTEEYSLGFREAFDFPEGRIGVNADYSQIELRIVAAFSRCPIFTRAFNEGKDLHATTASLIYNVPYELCADEKHEFYKKYRKPSKNINFGIVYGIGPPGLAAQLSISVDEAREIIKKHREAHPVLWAYLDKQAETAIKTLRARTASGRMQRFTRPNTEAETGQPVKWEVAAIGRNGKNMPIQGCLGGNSRILVQGSGYVKISDAKKTLCEVWDGQKLQDAFVTESGKKQKVIVKTRSGNDIECSPIHKFWARNDYKSYEWVEAQNLTRNHKIQLGYNTEDFDFFDKKEFYLLKKLSSKEIGVLVASKYLFGYGDDNVFGLYLKERDYTLYNIINNIFYKLGLTFTQKRAYHSGNNVRVSFDTISPQLVGEVNKLLPKNKLPEEFWTSKALLQGFLSVIFDYAPSGFEWMQLKTKRENLQFFKDLQQALYLFGINSGIVYGLRNLRFNLGSKDIYRLICNVGIITESKILKLTDFDKLKKFSMSKKNNEMVCHVSEVTVTDEFIDMYDVADSKSSVFVANGLITHNTSADILKRALRLLYDNLKGMDAKIVNIVHDEITVECDDKIAEEVKVILAKSMKDAGEEFLTNIPIKVDAKIIKNWADK